MKYFTLCFILMNITSFSFADTQNSGILSTHKKFAQLEKTFNGKIGVYVIDTNSNKIIAYRTNTLFPMQCTYRIIAIGALLKQSDINDKLLNEKIHYSKKNFVFWHPVTGEHVQTGMTLKALAQAAITYGDSTAINLITKKLGGYATINKFAHGLNNKTYNIKHYEPDLNSNPMNRDDSSTPKEMALSLKKLTLGNILKQPKRHLLIKWMRNSTTGYRRIRAGVPVGWAVADKTGSGSHGVANDIALVWSPACKPIVLAIYTIKNKRSAKWQDNIIANATHIVMNTFAKVDPCFDATRLS